VETGVYTINFMPSSLHRSVHQTSAKFPEEVSEFQACGFEEEYVSDHAAPFVKEAIVKVAMRFVSQQELNVNGTILVIGALHQIMVDDESINSEGFFNPEKADVLTCAGLDAYTRVVMTGRWSYARPDQPVKPLEH